MSVVQKGIMFLVTPVYTRLLTTEEYGYYSLYATWVSLFLVLATLNLGAGCFNNAMLKYESDKYRYMSSIVGLGGFSTAVVFAAVLVFLRPFLGLSGLDIPSFLCMFIVCMFNPAFGYWSASQRFNYNYRLMVAITIAQSVITPTLSVILIYLLEDKKYAILLGNAVTQAGVGIGFCLYLLYKGKRLYVSEYWRFALKFNLPLIPHYLSSTVLGGADRIMINYYCGQGKVGIYSLGYNVSMLVNIFVTAIGTTLAPWTYRNLKDHNEKKIGMYANYILIAVGTFAIIGVLIAPELICILGTSEYMEAKWIMAPVMLSCYFVMINSLFANIEFYYEKSIYIMLSSVMAAVSNVALNAVFIPLFGYLAAGYTTLVSYMILTFLQYLFMKKVSRQKKLGQVYDIKTIMIISVVVFIVSFAVMVLYNMVIIRYLIIISVICAVYIKRKEFSRILRVDVYDEKNNWSNVGKV